MGYLILILPGALEVSIPTEIAAETHFHVQLQLLLSTFVVVGVVNTEMFVSFIKLPFYNQTG